MDTKSPEPRRVLAETGLILAIVLAVQLLAPSLGMLAALVIGAYFFIERAWRRRPWSEVGFDLRTTGQGLIDNAGLILIVAVVIQLAVVAVGRIWIPDYIQHVIERLPIDASQWGVVVPVILIASLLEEITYRAFFQQHLNWFMPTTWAVAIVAVAFGLAHIAPGQPAIVALDVLLVMVDGAFYGVIYARSQNVAIAWIAHALADLMALIFLMLL